MKKSGKRYRNGHTEVYTTDNLYFNMDNKSNKIIFG